MSEAQPLPEDFDLELPEESGTKRTGGIYGMYGTDKAMEQQGIVLDLGDVGSIKIARSGGHNPGFAESYNRRFRPYEKQQRAKTLSETIAKKVLAEVYAESIVKGWEGLYDPAGKPIPYSFDNCVKLLLDLPDLFQEIRSSAAEAALYRMQEAEETAGNS